jgi:hypothetical protein
VTDELLAARLSEARHGRRVRLAEAELSLVSSDADLPGRLAGLLRADATEDDRAAGRTSPRVCLVESTARLPEWRARYCHAAPRIAEQPEIGRVVLHAYPGGMAMVSEGLGLLLVGEQGPVACLTEPVPEGLSPDRRPNLARLAIVLRSEWLLSAGRLVVHAGAVGREGACEIWTGASGAGKTTRVLRLAAAGWDFYGDDQVIVGRDGEGGFRIWPDWRPPRVTPDTRRSVPQLAVLEGRPAAGDGKQDFGFEKVFGGRRPAPGRVVAVHCLVPDTCPVDRRLDSAEAFERVAPGLMHFVWPGHAGWVTELVLDLLASVPVRLVSWGALEEEPAREGRRVEVKRRSSRAEDASRMAEVLVLSLSRDGTAWIDGAGWSMFPTSPPGSRLRVAAPAATLGVGEIVVFTRGAKLVAHRLVRRVSEGWIAKGDGTPRQDPPLAETEILGVVHGLRFAGVERGIRADPRAAALSRVLGKLFDWTAAGSACRALGRATYVVVALPGLLGLMVLSCLKRRSGPR